MVRVGPQWSAIRVSLMVAGLVGGPWLVGVSAGQALPPAEKAAPPAQAATSPPAAPGSESPAAVQPADQTPVPPAPPPEPPSAAAPAADPYNFWTTKRLTGDWGGARTRLEDLGISFKLTSQTQYMINMQGGLETVNGSDWANSYDLSLELDFGKMKLIPGGTFFIRGKGTSGGEDSDFDKEKIGGLFKTNADADIEEPMFVDKWWWRQRLFDDRLEFRLGRIASAKDLFDVNAVAGSEDEQFLNSSLSANPTIPHKNGLGAYLALWPAEWLVVRAAVIDPQARARRTGFDTAFHDDDRVQVFTEVGLVPKFPSVHGALTGHYLFGTWYYPYPKQIHRNDWEGVRVAQYSSGDMGFYFGCDQMVWKENDQPKDKQGLSVFARYGYAHQDVNRMSHFWSTGAQYAGLIPERDKDVLGFGVAQGILSEEYATELRPLADRETVYELYYALQIAPWCVFTPDLQYITQPGGDSDDRDAFVAGMRLRVSY